MRKGFLWGVTEAQWKSSSQHLLRSRGCMVNPESCSGRDSLRIFSSLSKNKLILNNLYGISGLLTTKMNLKWH
jgi:hypothetical protein